VTTAGKYRTQVKKTVTETVGETPVMMKMRMEYWTLLITVLTILMTIKLTGMVTEKETPVTAMMVSRDRMNQGWTAVRRCVVPYVPPMPANR
jgi:hypothetical protein